MRETEVKVHVLLRKALKNPETDGYERDISLIVVTHSQETCTSCLRKFLASNVRASSCRFG